MKYRAPGKFMAVGCGDQVALGAMYAAHRKEKNPERLAKIALEAAAEYSAFVRGPFTFKTLRKGLP